LSYLIDTNVISELRKRDRCDANVAAWYYGAVAEDELFLSTLVLGEIRRGVELARLRDPAQAVALERWLAQVIFSFGSRVLGVSNDVAEHWGRICAVRSVPVVDGLLAATAIAHGLTLATRNERDVAGLGAAVVNPFRSGEATS